MTENWSKIRAEFPALQRWTYLNTATYGQMPRCAVEAITRHSEQRDELACTNFLDWYAETDRMRASIARLIHAEPDDIAFVSNAAAALSIVVVAFGWSCCAAAPACQKQTMRVTIIEPSRTASRPAFIQPPERNDWVGSVRCS